MVHLLFHDASQVRLMYQVYDSNLAHNDPQWHQDDYSIQTWLYATISTDILFLVMQPNNMTYAVWSSLEGLFRSNKRTWANYL